MGHTSGSQDGIGTISFGKYYGVIAGMAAHHTDPEQIPVHPYWF